MKLNPKAKAWNLIHDKGIEEKIIRLIRFCKQKEEFANLKKLNYG